MSVDVKYRTTAPATGGRDGQASTADGSLNVKLTTPKELGGAGGPGNNAVTGLSLTTTGLGGAVQNEASGLLTIADSTVTANVAATSGGAINNLGALVLASATFSDNQAPTAGAIDNAIQFRSKVGKVEMAMAVNEHAGQSLTPAQTAVRYNADTPPVAAAGSCPA